MQHEETVHFKNMISFLVTFHENRTSFMRSHKICPMIHLDFPVLSQNLDHVRKRKYSNVFQKMCNTERFFQFF